MNRENDSLRDALRALAAETAEASAPDRVRQSLHSELRGRARRRRLAAWWPAAAAAALLLGIWLGRPNPAQPPAGQPSVAAIESVPPEASQALSVAPPALSPAPPAAEPAADRAPKAQLVTATAPAAGRAMTPWFFYSGLPQAERGQVVRIRVSAATAAQFGVFRGTDDVPAQVFIGDDGVARAIRFVR